MTIPIPASQHLIKAVTVFSSRKAEVVRTFSVDLAEGQNELTITSLPSCIDTDSARVTGLGDAVLFDVVCTVDDANDAVDENAESLKALERRRTLLEGEKALRGKAADILAQYGTTLSAEYTTGDTVQSFLDSLVQRGSSTLEEIKEIDEQIAEVDRDIAKEKRRLQKERQKASILGRVSAVIMAKRAGKVEVTLTYMVSNATWSPSYDLRATTEDGKPSGTVSLHYRASIQQNTGEDWRETDISVSTATPGSWSSIPGLRSMKISPITHFPFQSNVKTGNIIQQQPQQQAHFLQNQNAPALFGASAVPPPPAGASTMAPSVLARARGGGGPTSNTNAAPTFATGAAFGQPSSTFAFATTQAAAPSGDAGDDWTTLDREREAGASFIEQPEEPVVGAWTETKAVVTESAVASSFRIEGKCTIPSEPTAHKVAIAILSFNAKVNYITVPRSAPVAFLQCEVKNTSEYRLLGGSVNVFLDNSPVSKTTINNVAREEVFKCTLGPDPSLRIKYTRLPRTVASSGSAFAAQTTVTTYKLFTVVHNAHSFAVKGIQVRDAAPDVGQGHSPGTSTTNANAGGSSGIKVVIKRPEGLGEASHWTLVDVPIPKTPSNGSTTRSVKVRWEYGGGERDGKYVWVVDLGPGEEVKLEAEYEIRAPADFQWQLKEDMFH